MDTSDGAKGQAMPVLKDRYAGHAERRAHRLGKGEIVDAAGVAPGLVGRLIA